MPINPIFSSAPGYVDEEQLFVEDLVCEIITNWGQNIFYLPRTSLDVVDSLYGESPISSFNVAFPVEAMLSSVMGPTGQSEFFSKFVMEIRDSIHFFVARRTFKRWVPTINRPREGDLIWVPSQNKLYEIKFVEQDTDYHQLGRKPPLFFMFDLNMELFKFSNERFKTGIADIDAIGRQYSYSIGLEMNSTQYAAPAYIQGEVVYQGASYSTSTASAIVKFWNSSNNFLQIINIKGIFGSANVIGNTSNAIYSVNTYNAQDFSGILESPADNLLINTEADEVIVFSNDNPFGEE